MSDNWMMEHLLGEGECIFFFFFFFKIRFDPEQEDVSRCLYGVKQ